MYDILPLNNYGYIDLKLIAQYIFIYQISAEMLTLEVNLK